MATGTPKTQWNGEKLYIANSNGSGNMAAMQLHYEGKRPEREILQTRPAPIQALWYGGAGKGDPKHQIASIMETTSQF